MQYPRALTHEETNTILEAIRQYGLKEDQEKEVWRRVEEALKWVSPGPFYAYATAHSICSDVVRETTK